MNSAPRRDVKERIIQRERQTLWNTLAPGGRMRALYGSQDGRHYGADNLWMHGAQFYY